jgi:hypothetical protein
MGRRKFTMKVSIELTEVEATDLVAALYVAASLHRQELGADSGLVRSYEAILEKAQASLAKVTEYHRELHNWTRKVLEER